MSDVPVIVGVGRRTWKPDARQPVAARCSPVDMMEVVARAAAADAVGAEAAGALLAGVDAVAAVPMSLDVRLPKGAPKPYANLPHSVATRVGAKAAQRGDRLLTTGQGGHAPLLLFAEAAAMLAAGQVGSVLLCGAESLATFARAVKEGYTLPGWPKGVVRDAQGRVVPAQEGAQPRVLPWGGDKAAPKPTIVSPHLPPITDRHEARHGLGAPTTAYALIEQAQRRRRGEDPSAAQKRTAARFSALSGVAAKSPEHSWFPHSRSASEIGNQSAENRMVAYPYTKYMCAVMDVDQAAACIVMSERAALAAGVPRERLVYVHGTADCSEEPALLSERSELAQPHSLSVLAKALEESSGVRTASCKHVDIYSCFPCAVDAAAQAMGLDHLPGDRLTAAGGLPYHGGPGNNYSLHSLAAVVPALRADAGSFGLVTANGGYLTKHAACILSTVPYSATHGGRPYVRRDSSADQSEVARIAGPPAGVDTAPEGSGVVEVWTVLHGRKGPERAVALGRMADGRRFIANSRDAATMQRLERVGGFDLPCHVTTSGDPARSTFRLTASSL